MYQKGSHFFSVNGFKGISIVNGKSIAQQTEEDRGEKLCKGFKEICGSDIRQEGQ